MSKMKIIFMAVLSIQLISTSEGHTSITIASSAQEQKIQTTKFMLPPEIINHDLAEKLAVALQIGRQAGQAILSVKQSRNLQVEIKADNTPVTDADRASNSLICQAINHLYPKDGILSEETMLEEKSLNDVIAKGVNAEWTWVIDPLDGTKAFIKSTAPNSSNLDPRYQGKHYGVHIGLLCKGEAVLGVNYYPEIDTLYFVLDGFAYKQIGDAAAVRIINKPISGVHPVLNPTTNERDMVGKIYQKLLGEAKAAEVNNKGLFLDSFGYKMVTIAEGNGCNLFIAPAGGPGFWDVCSMLPLVQAVGGTVTDWEGNPIDFQDMSQLGLIPKGVIISMNPEIHRQIVAIIAELILHEEIPRYGRKNLK